MATLNLQTDVQPSASVRPEVAIASAMKCLYEENMRLKLHIEYLKRILNTKQKSIPEWVL